MSKENDKICETNDELAASWTTSNDKHANNTDGHNDIHDLSSPHFDGLFHNDDMPIHTISSANEDTTPDQDAVDVIPYSNQILRQLNVM